MTLFTATGAALTVEKGAAINHQAVRVDIRSLLDDRTDRFKLIRRPGIDFGSRGVQ